MITLKIIFLILIFGSSSMIGIIIAKQYSKRLEELEDMKNALNLIETKIRFSKEPLSLIFKDISNVSKNKEIFEKTNENMNDMLVGKAWKEAVEKANTNFKKEDIKILLMLGNMLGKTDSEGQINNIEEIKELLNIQIENANLEKQKNEKLYKTLGMTIGLVIIIMLI